MQIPFAASSRALVREIYHPDDYGAFALDPDGHNIEAVCRLTLAEAGE